MNFLIYSYNNSQNLYPKMAYEIPRFPESSKNFQRFQGFFEFLPKILKIPRFLEIHMNELCFNFFKGYHGREVEGTCSPSRLGNYFRKFGFFCEINQFQKAAHAHEKTTHHYECILWLSPPSYDTQGILACNLRKCLTFILKLESR